MGERVYNFSAGPAAMPLEVLEASARALVDYEGKGFGIAEVSHRGSEFLGVLEEATRRCKDLLGIADSHEVVFLQGGATQQFELIPMNFLHKRAAYIDSGQWAAKAMQAGERYGEVRCLGSSKEADYRHLPAVADLDVEADYLHICSNNTIFGTRFPSFPEHPRLVADMSSEIMARQLDPARFAMIYAGAQKNLGPSGVVLAVIRKDFLERARDALAPIFSYGAHVAKDSCLNTPPTFGIYVLLETFRWLERQGGLAGIEAVNRQKAELLYGAIDASEGFYTGTVTEAAERSHMNVTFTLPDEELTKAFLAGATERGLVALKGYRTVGGVRASIYNALPLAGVERLVEWMQDFATRHRL